MKSKQILLFLFLLLASTSVYAGCPAVGGSYDSLHQEYLCKRYVTMNYTGAEYRIDFSQVQQVIQDTHGHAQHTLSPKSKWVGAANSYYVIFNNGGWQVFSSISTTPKPADAWDAYRDFLIDNPQFIGMR